MRRLHRVIQNGLSSALFAGIAFMPVMELRASDHIDSPTVAQDRGSDIADLWAFLDPNDNTQVILVLSTQGALAMADLEGILRREM